MMKLNYEKPMSELVELESADVIVTSRVVTDLMGAVAASIDDESDTTSSGLDGGVKERKDSYGNTIGYELT